MKRTARAYVEAVVAAFDDVAQRLHERSDAPEDRAFLRGRASVVLHAARVLGVPVPSLERTREEREAEESHEEFLAHLRAEYPLGLVLGAGGEVLVVRAGPFYRELPPGTRGGPPAFVVARDGLAGPRRIVDLERPWRWVRDPADLLRAAEEKVERFAERVRALQEGVVAPIAGTIVGLRYRKTGVPRG